MQTCFSVRPGNKVEERAVSHQRIESFDEIKLLT